MRAIRQLLVYQPVNAKNGVCDLYTQLPHLVSAPVTVECGHLGEAAVMLQWWKVEVRSACIRFRPTS